MKRFFSTFFLLAGVAFSLIISDSFFKNQKQQYSSEKINNDLNKSIDLTEADVFDTKKSTDRISLTN